MFIYYALINALSARMIHINLNMIFYTRGAESYQNNLHKALYKKKKKKRRKNITYKTKKYGDSLQSPTHMLPQAVGDSYSVVLRVEQ